MTTTANQIKITVVSHNGSTTTDAEELEVNPNMKLSTLVDRVKKDDGNVISFGKSILHQQGPNGQKNDHKSLIECDIANGDLVIVFHSKHAYDSAWEKKRHDISLDAANPIIRGNFELGYNGDYFEAKHDENGKPLFCPEHVFKLVNKTLCKLRDVDCKHIMIRNANGILTKKPLIGSKGKKTMLVLKTIHYNLHAKRRFSSRMRESMMRAIYYTFKHLFNKESYNEEVRAILNVLSEAMRVKVGDEWVAVPIRAFNIVSEIKGVYDGELIFDYEIGDRKIKFDCDCIVNRWHNKGGYTVTEYYRTALLGMETREFDKIVDSVSVSTDAKCVLLIEDGGVFKYLQEVEFWKYFPVVLVCCHGHSDLVTRAFVHMLHNCVGLPVYAIGDLNAGGIDVMHQFGKGNNGEYETEEDVFCTTKVGWMALRPSQLKKLKTSKRSGARNLLHKTIKKIAGMFSAKRLTRLDKHINGDTTWIENGGGRKDVRAKEMKEMKDIGYGFDLESAEDDQVIKFILRQLMKVWAGLDTDKEEFAFV